MSENEPYILLGGGIIKPVYMSCVFIQALVNTTKLNKEASGLGTPPFCKSFK